jgi:hypothetical protein
VLLPQAGKLVGDWVEELDRPRDEAGRPYGLLRAAGEGGASLAHGVRGYGSALKL